VTEEKTKKEQQGLLERKECTKERKRMKERKVKEGGEEKV
jgi:hypothetical protein